MNLSLQTAQQHHFAFCESLNRDNMAIYLKARNIVWQPSRFAASWTEFENLVILADSEPVGTIRLLAENDALVIRDLQVMPTHQNKGIGSWAVKRIRSAAASRNFQRLRLRVFEDNPAKVLYLRLGFQLQSIEDGTATLCCSLTR